MEGAVWISLSVFRTTRPPSEGLCEGCPKRLAFVAMTLVPTKPCRSCFRNEISGTRTLLIHCDGGGGIQLWRDAGVEHCVGTNVRQTF